MSGIARGYDAVMVVPFVRVVITCMEPLGSYVFELSLGDGLRVSRA